MKTPANSSPKVEHKHVYAIILYKKRYPCMNKQTRTEFLHFNLLSCFASHNYINEEQTKSSTLLDCGHQFMQVTALSSAFH